MRWMLYERKVANCGPLVWLASNWPFLLAVLGNVASATTDSTQDGVGDDGLGLLHLFQLAQAIILPQGAVQEGQFPQLLAPQIILSLWHLYALPDDLLDLLHSLLHVLRVVGSHVRMQGLILTRQWLSVLPSNLAFLYRPLASDNDLGSGLIWNL